MHTFSFLAAALLFIRVRTQHGTHTIRFCIARARLSFCLVHLRCALLRRALCCPRAQTRACAAPPVSCFPHHLLRRTTAYAARIRPVVFCLDIYLWASTPWRWFDGLLRLVRVWTPVFIQSDTRDAVLSLLPPARQRPLLNIVGDASGSLPRTLRYPAANHHRLALPVGYPGLLDVTANNGFPDDVTTAVLTFVHIYLFSLLPLFLSIITDIGLVG